MTALHPIYPSPRPWTTRHFWPVFWKPRQKRLTISSDKLPASHWRKTKKEQPAGCSFLKGLVSVMGIQVWIRQLILISEW